MYIWNSRKFGKKVHQFSLELSNLQILCAMCNQGKGAWDETDFRLAILDKGLQ